jgi:hypothetical protein
VDELGGFPSFDDEDGAQDVGGEATARGGGNSSSSLSDRAEEPASSVLLAPVSASVVQDGGMSVGRRVRDIGMGVETADGLDDVTDVEIGPAADVIDPFSGDLECALSAGGDCPWLPLTAAAYEKRGVGILEL